MKIFPPFNSRWVSHKSSAYPYIPLHIPTYPTSLGWSPRSPSASSDWGRSFPLRRQPDLPSQKVQPSMKNSKSIEFKVGQISRSAFICYSAYKGWTISPCITDVWIEGWTCDGQGTGGPTLLLKARLAQQPKWCEFTHWQYRRRAKLCSCMQPRATCTSASQRCTYSPLFLYTSKTS